MIIIFTGTPGTGKTTLAKELAKKLKIPYLDVNIILQEYNLRETYDKKDKTFIVDEKKLSKTLIKIILKSKDLVIDSHLSHYIPSKYVDYCIVTKADLKILKKRLEERKYPKNKIKDNLESEALDICLVDALELNHKVIQVDTTKNSIKKCIELITNEIIRNKR
jgi:adenylate kinase